MANVFSPLRIGTMEIKNRIVAAPTVSNWADEVGNVTQRMLDAYAARAAGGAGLVVVEATYIRPDGCNFRRMLGLYNDRQVTGHNELAEVIRMRGAKSALQIMHGGRTARYPATGVQPVAPSARRPWVVNPRELTTRECEELVEAFAIAAGRAKEAGYDAIWIHGAHGFLITQFMSPFTNFRTDKYGDLMRFPTEVVQAIRKVVGKDYPIVIRINGDDFLGDKGITLELAIEQAKALEQAGVDAIDVSAAPFEVVWHQIQPLYFRRGYLVHLGEAIKKAVSIPVGVAGRINDPRLVESIIGEDKVNFVSLCRVLLADPEFPNKMRDGRYDEIRKCLADGDGCLKRLFQQYAITCAINPALGREKEYELTPARRKKKVVVMGGGIAGMEAARLAAEKGHDVVLFEKRSELGGSLMLTARMRNVYLRELENIVQWEEVQLRKLGVEVRLGEEASVESVIAEKPDAAIVAVGGRPDLPQVPGVERSHVWMEDDYLEGTAVVGKHVAVIGGQWGAEVAVSVAGRNDVETVTIVEESDDIGSVYDGCRQAVLKQMLEQRGVKCLTGHHVLEITDDGVRVLSKDWEERFIPADTVIVAIGRRPQSEMAEALRNRIPEVYGVGDCVLPNYKPITAAFEMANHVARKL